jgi:hypothetical protein
MTNIFWGEFWKFQAAVQSKVLLLALILISLSLGENTASYYK